MNYPDDINRFNHDPRSPLYIDDHAESDDIRDRVENLLDADNEASDAIEILIESDAFVTQLRHLLSLTAYNEKGRFKLEYARKQAVAEAANGLILEAEDYLAKFLEETNV